MSIKLNKALNWIHSHFNPAHHSTPGYRIVGGAAMSILGYKDFDVFSTIDVFVENPGNLFDVTGRVSVSDSEFELLSSNHYDEGGYKGIVSKFKQKDGYGINVYYQTHTNGVCLTFSDGDLVTYCGTQVYLPTLRDFKELLKTKGDTRKLHILQGKSGHELSEYAIAVGGRSVKVMGFSEADAIRNFNSIQTTPLSHAVKNDYTDDYHTRRGEKVFIELIND